MLNHKDITEQHFQLLGNCYDNIKKPGEALKLAVKRMLPGGVLGKKQLTKLKIYSGNEHPHAAQNPKIIELKNLNNKNIVRN